MNRTMLAVLVAMVSCIVLLIPCDDSEASDGFRYDPTGRTLTISSDVPDYGDGDERPWEAHANQVVRVNIPDGIRHIGDRAFKGMDALQFVRMPDGVERIGVEAFSGCSSLNSMTLGPGLRVLGDRAFEGCGRMAELFVECEPECGSDVFAGSGAEVDGVGITIRSRAVPDNMFYVSGEQGLLIHSLDMPLIGTIGAGSFRNVVLFESDIPPIVESSIVIPPGVASIGEYAFAGSNISGLLFEGIPEIGWMAFSDCADLETVDLYNFAEVGRGAFSGSGLKSVTFSNRIRTIGEQAFKGTEIVDLLFPGSLEAVDSGAFSDCASLVHVGFTYDLNRLSDYAFSGCASLRTVEIQKVSYPGTDVFLGCDSIERAYSEQDLFEMPPSCRLYTKLTDGEDVMIGYDFGSMGGGCVLFSDTQFRPNMIRGATPGEFVGWSFDDGRDVQSISSISSSTTIHARWIQSDDDSPSSSEVAVCAMSVLCAAVASVCFFRRD